MKTNAYLPDQSVSDSAKQDDEWIVPTYDYWITKCKESKNNSDTIEMINAANGDVDTKTIDYLLKPFNNDHDDLNSELPFGTRSTDIITPIVEKTMGEYIELPNNVNVNFHDSSFATMQDLEMRRIIEDIVKLGIAKKIKEDEQSEQQSTPEEITAYIEEKKAEYLKSESLKAKRFLQYVNEKADFDYYRLQMFYNWWTTEECYVHRTIEDGDFIKTIIPPQHGYPYNSDVDFVEDAAAFMWEERMTWEDFVLKERNNLSKTQLDYLDSLVGADTIGGSVSAPTHLITERSKYNWYRIDNPNSVLSDLTTDSKDITVYNLVFKTFRKVKKLTYLDYTTGKEVVTVVPKDYKLNVTIGDIKIESHSIVEVYSGKRFGSEGSGIYSKPDKLLVQRDGKLPVTGKRFILKNKKVNPVPYRLIAYQVIDMMLNLHIERTLAKYKDDLLIIPQSMLASDKSGTTAQKTFYMYRDGRIVYNDAIVDINKVAQGLRLIQGSSTDKYIKTLMELQQYYLSRANQLASMNEDRLGNIDTRSAVSNVEQNIYRSKLGTVLSLDVFRKILEKEHEADLDYAKYLFIDGVNDTMFDENGNIIHLELDGYLNFSRTYGIYIENGNKVDKKLSQIRQMAIAASQSGELSGGITAIKSDNVEEIEEAISKMEEAKKAFELDMKDKEADNQRQAEEAAKGLQAQAQANDLEKVNLEADRDLEKTITVKEYDLSIASLGNETTRQGNEIDAETARSSNATRERIDAAKNQAKLQSDKIKAKATADKVAAKPKPKTT